MNQKQEEAEALNKLFSIRWKYYDKIADPEQLANLLEEVRKVIEKYSTCKSYGLLLEFAISILDDIEDHAKIRT